MHDLNYAFRQLAKSPGFTLIAVLTLALGIGANTALFSLIDDVLLRSLPAHKPNELVLLRWLSNSNAHLRGIVGETRKDPVIGLSTSPAMSYFVFERLQNQGEALSDVFAFASLGRPLNVNIDDQAETAKGQVVSGGYFNGLGVRAIRGRMLDVNDDQATAVPAAVISYRFWQQRLGGDNAVIGKIIRVNAVAVTIVGVAPRDFNGTLQLGEAPDLTLPIALEPRLHTDFAMLHQPALWWTHIIGRLRPGFTAEQAQAQLEPIFVRAAHDGLLASTTGSPTQSLKTAADLRLRLEPGGQGLLETRRSYARSFRILGVIVGLVLLIACANIAGLLLARAATRRKEIAVRLSVGAGRGRIIRQLLVESTVLALLGGALGLLFAFWGRDALQHLRPMGAGSFDLNLRVLAFTLAASTFTGLFFGLAPAWLATRVDLTSALKENSGGSAGPAGFVLRRALIVLQVSLSVVLLIGAGLLLRTLHNFRTLDAGFDRENLIYFRVDAGDKYRGPQISSFFDRLLERLSALPGVRSTALSYAPLLSGSQPVGRIVLDNPRLPPGAKKHFSSNVVSPSFFQAMGIPLLRGRSLSERDTESSPHVAVVNETFARTFFPGENPIGRSFGVGGSPAMRRPARQVEIVGVVRDAHYANLRQAVLPTAYFSFYQDVWSSMVFAVRTSGDPSTLVPSIRTALRDLNPNLPLQDVRTQDEQVAALLSEERLFATLSAFFGLVALGLTSIGLYGLLTHQVISRTREIGIRLALGAQLRAIAGLVLSEALCLVVIGLVLGLGAGLALTRYVSHLLFQVQPADPLTLVGAGLLLVLIALLACWLPARRAAGIDPMSALRAD